MTERFTTPDEVIDACEAARSLAPTEVPSDLAPDASIGGAPGWHPFEHAAWPIGESIRLSLKEAPSLKRDSRALDAVADVVRCRNLRRGRQSFVMALGFTGAARYAPVLADYLTDPDIAGQVLDTLRQMRAGGYDGAVAPLLRARHAWIRNLARRYLDRFAPAV
jgi:hypothetical protein